MRPTTSSSGVTRSSSVTIWVELLIAALHRHRVRRKPDGANWRSSPAAAQQRLILCRPRVVLAHWSRAAVVPAQPDWIELRPESCAPCSAALSASVLFPTARNCVACACDIRPSLRLMAQLSGKRARNCRTLRSESPKSGKARGGVRDLWFGRPSRAANWPWQTRRAGRAAWRSRPRRCRAGRLTGLRSRPSGRPQSLYQASGSPPTSAINAARPCCMASNSHPAQLWPTCARKRVVCLRLKALFAYSA